MFLQPGGLRCLTLCVAASSTFLAGFHECSITMSSDVFEGIHHEMKIRIAMAKYMFKRLRAKILARVTYDSFPFVKVPKTSSHNSLKKAVMRSISF